jgi:hypothetical protein
MPDKVYTTGDEVRLSVEIITEENPTFVTAVFRAEDNVRQTFTMHDDLVLDEPLEVFPQRIPTKTYRAKLVSLIDVDNPPGVYRLDSIMYGDPADGTTTYETSFGEEAPVFYVYKGHDPKSERVTARLVAPDKDE